jgi:4-oxalocrotonate tautomerase
MIAEKQIQAGRQEMTMPIVRIDLLEGRSPAMKTELIARVTEAVTTSLQVRPEQVRVIIYEIPAAHYAVGGVIRANQQQSAADGDKPQVAQEQSAGSGGA